MTSLEGHSNSTWSTQLRNSFKARKETGLVSGNANSTPTLARGLSKTVKATGHGSISNSTWPMQLKRNSLPNVRSYGSLQSGTSQTSCTSLSTQEQQNVSSMDNGLWKELQKELSTKKAVSKSDVTRVTREFLEKKEGNLVSPEPQQQNVKKENNILTKSNRMHSSIVDEDPADDVIPMPVLGRAKTLPNMNKIKSLVPNTNRWGGLRSIVMSSMEALATEVNAEDRLQPEMKLGNDVRVLPSNTNIAMPGFEDSINLCNNAFTGSLILESPDGSDALLFERSGSNIMCSSQNSGKSFTVSKSQLEEALTVVEELAENGKEHNDFLRILAAAENISCEDIPQNDLDSSHETLLVGFAPS